MMIPIKRIASNFFADNQLLTITSQTRPSLLIRVRDRNDSDAWAQFVEIYAPLVVNFARKRGLQDADAADLAQEVLQKVANGISRFHYDPRQGTFRSWLYRITRNSLSDYSDKAKRQIQGSGDTRFLELLKSQCADDEMERQWDHEHSKHLLVWALDKLRIDFSQPTIEAFERTMLREEETSSVANALGMSVGAVYIAKSRVLVRLKEVMHALNDQSLLGAEHDSR